MGSRAYIAVDLGAESGRVMVGSLDGSAPRLQLHELHRFTHKPLTRDGALRWDVDRLWAEILAGLATAASWTKQSGAELVSIGVDTWGVDYALVDGKGELLELPRAYRDARHAQGLHALQRTIGSERLYAITGIQQMAINTLPQLAAARSAGDHALTEAKSLLFIPDYLHFRLSGVMANESSIASTSQLLDARTGRWAGELLDAVGIAPGILTDPIAPGTVLGSIRPEIAAKTGLPPSVRIVAPGSHDTASAIAAVPAGARVGGAGIRTDLETRSWAYLSSGTWSLFGVELDQPLLSPAARSAGFTNERGVDGKIRFLKNLVGLWPVQQIREELRASHRDLDYPALVRQAEASTMFRSRINASHPSLVSPGEMIKRVQTLAANAGDPVPETPGDLVRCCLEGLAMECRRCLDQLESVLGRRLEVIHMVGGGSRNALLCHMTAEALGRPVLAGPVEATATGNVLVQAMADGRVKDLQALRRIVSNSFDLVEYRPSEVGLWDAAYRRHQQVWATAP